jgi:3-oxoacyl-(acyl-carrier-protein) synthase
MISDIACGHISIKYGLDPFATVSACAFQMQQLFFNYIRLGHDVMVTGGSEAAVT